MLFSKRLGKHTVSAYSEEKGGEGVGGGEGGGVDRRKRRVEKRKR